MVERSTARPAWSAARWRHRADQQLRAGKLRAALLGCPLWRRCTTAKGGRILRLHPHQDELRAARRRAVTRSHLFPESDAALRDRLDMLFRGATEQGRNTGA